MTHYNYVLTFSDGTSKVGVTSCPARRIREHRRAKRGCADPVLCMVTPPSERSKAFKTEREICRLLEYRRAGHSKEWFKRDAPEDEFMFLKNTTGMFWILNNRGAQYAACEVAV